ncbi:MAG: hemolysin family protein [Alphaproteobacteria bacterium]|nr:hemolysin family protein [Alphaproteobacteria bacterium]MCY4318242.1 hemolysin family protein [Alphaproteobacteria bacterium]
MDTTPHTPNGNGGRFKGFWRRLSGRRNNEGSISETLSDLAARHTADATPIDPLERALLENTLKLRRMTIEDVMVPRADIVAVSVAAPLEEVVAAVEQSRHSRLPVFEKDLDQIVGMIHVKDVLVHIGQSETPSLKELAREVLFVSPAMLVLDLLLEMRLKRTHMALVVDEFGGIDGLATIEDLVEEIVGDIEDEHDIAEPPQLEARPDGTLVADARATLEDFEAAVGDVLADEEREDIDTLGGLVFNLVGRVPSRGELVSHPSGLEFEVLDGDPRRLKRLRVRNLPAGG